MSKSYVYKCAINDESKTVLTITLRFPSPSIRERKWPIVNENSAHHYTDSCIPAGFSIFPTPYKTANHKRVHAHVQAASWAIDAVGKIQIPFFF